MAILTLYHAIATFVVFFTFFLFYCENKANKYQKPTDTKNTNIFITDKEN